ncbi:MAG: DUF2097 domain-containing protein [Methanobacterium sp.]|jgi:hypothetical protein|nr:DUF2097 domain-containing protein [Methanobacterium sp.]
MEEEIILKTDEVIEYLRDNVEEHDTIELSYNRIYAPGTVLGISLEDIDGEESLLIRLHLNGELVNDTVEVNIHAIKDDIIEIRHTRGEISTVIVVEE